MKLSQIIRADKSEVRITGWNTGKVSHACFPLTKKSALPAGSDWAWRVVEFDTLGRHFRVLIRLNEVKEYYSAILAMDDPRGLLVICHHELHTSHRDWHCHLVLGNAMSIYPGVLRDRDAMCIWPNALPGPCSITFTVNKGSAVTLAATRFRFESQGGLL